MRISDWSSDVCSSDLPDRRAITTSQIYLPTPPSKCSPRRSRRDGSASKHISSSRKNWASIISKAAPGLDYIDMHPCPPSPPLSFTPPVSNQPGGHTPAAGPHPPPRPPAPPHTTEHPTAG